MDGKNNNGGRGGWIFLSHSHRDIGSVRRIRNKFEELGFEPLMFYLKCLSDKDEIEGLVKREIDERDWFVYLDSPNARSSTWVQTELEYIATKPGKKIFTIDLSSDITTQVDLIRHITDQMKVFISYHGKDEELFWNIQARLLEKDMYVLSDKPSDEDINFGRSIKNVLDSACYSGFVIILITENIDRSDCFLKEIEYTVKNHGKLVPVYVGDATVSEELLPLLGDIQGVRLSETPTDEEYDNLIRSIINRVEHYNSDFRFSCGFSSATSIELPPISIIDDYTFDECVNLKEVYIPSSVISITKDAFRNQPGILVKCRAGSYAEKYCIENKVNYILV